MTKKGRRFLGALLGMIVVAGGIVGWYFCTNLAVENDTQIDIFKLGAVGDGITDDSAIFQQALNIAKERGKVSIYIPQGNYFIRDTLNYYPNTELEFADNAKITFDSASGIVMTNSNHLVGKDAFSCGYLRIKGGSFEGQYSDDQTQKVCIQAGKLSELSITGTSFLNACARNHLLDISGCQNIIIENCFFDGMNFSEELRPHDETENLQPNAKLEMIQIDLAKGLGTPVQSEEDEKSARNILIKNCVFGKKNSGQIEQIVSYRPIGIHNISQDETSCYDNIIIEGNEFYNCLGSCIRLSRVRNAVITENYFWNTDEVIDGVVVLALADSDGNEGDIQNIAITGNRCEYKKKYDFIRTEEGKEESSRIYNVVIRNNNVSQSNIRLKKCVNVLLEGNSTDAIYMDECKNVEKDSLRVYPD
ncbi:MAG: hypothetical protein GX234_07520 [Clostridiales bacterium]|nr:hypothetical protein [Clostridiales bacterium]